MPVKPAHEGALYSAIKQFPKKPNPKKDLKKEWCVYFHYLHNGTWQPVRRKADLNRIHTFKEKERELAAFKKAIKTAMDSGWNPITKKYETPQSDFQEVFDSRLNLVQAIDFAFSQCDVSDNTLRDYRNCVRKIKQALYHVHLEHTHIVEVRKKHIKVIMEKAKQLFNWSNNEYNKNLGYLSGILSRLVDFEILEYNPAHKISKLEVIEGPPKYVPYTKAEKKKIADHLFLHFYGFYVYFMTQYYTGMRPMEVLALKISDIDLRGRLITIVPSRKRKNSKTKKVRSVLINEHLLPLLREWISENKDYYVFGSPYQSGVGNRGSIKGREHDGALHPDYFKPSATRIKRDTTTKLWKKIVMTTLGIDKHQYAAKHTGTDDKLIAGISMEAIRDMLGHTTTFMTKRYQTVLKRLHQQELDEKSPSFI